MKQSAFLWKYEKFFFALVVVLTASPLLCNHYFPTVDGPAHLHNGNLLKHLWFYGNDFGRSFFDVNSQLNSNLLDHIWFAFFGLFLPTDLTEKSLLLVYVVSLPFSFRYLVKKIAGETSSAKLSSYLIFSFVYSFTFRIGFFNFCIGIPVLFWAFGYWIGNRQQQNAKKLLALTALSTLLYISHLFNFMLFGIVLFAYELQYLVHERKTKGIIKKLFYPFLVMVPGLLLSVLFFIANSSYTHEAAKFLPKENLVQTILDLNPIITLNYDKEILFAHIILYAQCILVLLVTIDFFRKRKEPRQFRPQWIISALIVLLLFFVFPDWIASGGFISIRWALYFFLVMMIVIAARGLPVNQLLIPVSVILLTHLFFMNYHNKETETLSKDAETLVDAEKYMEDDKVLLPLSYSTNWMHINYSNYLSTKKNVIVLDNYEPTKPHFPLIWKKGEEVYELMPGYGRRFPPCIAIEAYERKTKHRIDYLSRFCYEGASEDSCTIAAEQEIAQRFELIYQSENKKLQLYKRKPGT